MTPLTITDTKLKAAACENVGIKSSRRKKYYEKCCDFQTRWLCESAHKEFKKLGMHWPVCVETEI